MNVITKKIISNGRKHIDYNNTKELNKMIIDININRVNVPFIFKNLYLYACKTGTTEVISWFVKLYFELNDIEKIGLRQLFKYGNVIMRKNRMISLEWFKDFIDPLFVL